MAVCHVHLSLILFLAFHGTLCSNEDCCSSMKVLLKQDDGSSSNERNVLVNEHSVLNIETTSICTNVSHSFVTHYLVIRQRQRNRIDTYPLTNIKSQEDDYTEYDGILYNSGFYYHFICSVTPFECIMEIRFIPSNTQYNGANVSLLASCSRTNITSAAVTFNIQGLLEAPLDVLVDVVSSESVNVSWSPPFTLDGIPILHYTVSVISQGILTEEINTTETHITLERSCASTTYQISGWNEVGEGNATLSDLTMYEASVEVVSKLSEPGVCLTCTFFTDSTAEGCAMKLHNDEHTFVFKTSRHNDGLVVLDCFSVQEAGVFNVYVYEIQLGEPQEHSRRQLNDIEIVANLALADAAVRSINEGMCVSCYFISGSNAEGCVVKLQNDEHTFLFNVSRQKNELALLECFSVPVAGTFSVLVYEYGTDIMKTLPHITVSYSDTGQHANAAAVALGVVLSVVVIGGFVTAIILGRWCALKVKSKASTNIDEQLPISSVNGTLYDDIVLMAEQEPKEIEVTPNAAYAAVLTLR